MIKDFSFDLVFVKRFYLLSSQIQSRNTSMIICFLLFLAIIYETLSYNVGMITGDYYKVLGDKDWNGFWAQTWKSVIYIVCIAVAKSCKEYVTSVLQVEWRQMLTTVVHERYFSNLNYYNLNVMNRQNDNLDQRITQDIQEFCEHLAKVFPDLILAPIIIAFYTYKTWLVVGYIGPLGCLIFFLISTGINKSLISLVLKWVYQQQRSEGDFRYEHLHVRDSAESIAFLSGHTFEKSKSDKLLNKLIKVQECLILRQFYLKTSVYLFDYLGSIVAFLILSVPLFAGKFDNYAATEVSQLISQTSFMAFYLINCFTRLIDTSNDFASIGGTTHRVGEMLESFDNTPNPKNSRNSQSLSSLSPTYMSTDVSANPNNAHIYFTLSNVTICVPKSDRMLITKLDLELTAGNNLLISGDSGTSKTSILRVLKGIWTQKEGSIVRNLEDNPKMVMFLPQRPLLTTGSLIEQITYPLEPKIMKYGDCNLEDRIITYMKFLDLNEVLNRIDNDIFRQVDWHWTDCLSPGEQQRLSFVRLFYHRPVMAVLDESTSAVSEDMERKIYEECIRLGITLISCGHRQSIAKYHKYCLKIVKNSSSNGSENTHELQLLNSI